MKQVPAIIGVAKTMIKSASTQMLDAFVDSVFEFVDQPLLPSQVGTHISIFQASPICGHGVWVNHWIKLLQSNFAPVDELGESVPVASIEGQIPDDFPEGVYIRNGKFT